ncbi:MAG: deoxyribodipyrimidine photo-lyase, partial [Gammaproteobacteria bacterium]|nr:deoxyribodipyrimidine photo-lyase [Gammaproteobacteria bacterium]
SRLSAHLHFGEISPRQVWHSVNSELHFDSRLARGGEAWLREIGWREFSYHLLAHWPDLPEQPFRPEFSRFPWRSDPEALHRWQHGLTGYPLVDAGMRELWATGWMHNRVRMIVASFLVKHLMIRWQDGEAWFWDTLVDADLANNSAGWQWVAGSGADAAPFFRIFNPIVQGKKFDPDGAYVRRWVPELAGVPTKYLHDPWNAPADVLADADVSIGSDYPAPIVEHSVARERALAAFKSLKG